MGNQPPAGSPDPGAAPPALQVDVGPAPDPNPSAGLDEGVTETVQQASPEPAPLPQIRGLPSTRASRAWIRVLPAVVLAAIMLVFIFQNLRRTKLSFFTASGTVPLALALLAAAALGGLLVLALGSIRIFQLRKVIQQLRHAIQLHRRNDAARSAVAGGESGGESEPSRVS